MFHRVLFIFLLICVTAIAQTSKGPANAEADIIKLQILLSRAGFSTGEIDGKFGNNTKKALVAFQQARKLQITGRADGPTWEALGKGTPPVVPYRITAADVKGPFVDRIPEDFMEKANLPSLGYTSPLEAVAEKFHVEPPLLKRLNPKASFTEGEEITVPNIVHPKPQPKNAPTKQLAPVTIKVSGKRSDLTVQNVAGDVLFYAPVTSGSEHDPLPIGRWKVKAIVRNPTFHYNPDLFWDADPSHAKAKILPGPNNPVGVVWIDLSAPHYGIHGTPEPGKIGYSESHGCIRLTNWDALQLASIVAPGTEVIFEQ